MIHYFISINIGWEGRGFSMDKLLKLVEQWKIIADKWNRFTFLFWRQRSKGR